MTVTLNNSQKLYEIDDYQWLLNTIDLLKKHQFNELDLGNLIEELETMGSEKRNAVKSLLEQVMIHLLLLQFWSEEYEKNCYHWQGEILTFRTQLEDKLTANLKNYLAEQMPTIYQRALKQVKLKTRFKVEFPSECPYSLEQLLDENYLP